MKRQARATSAGDQTPPTSRLPALFATIHFHSPERPDGYTQAEISELNETANSSRYAKPR